MDMFMYSYSSASEGAALLRDALGVSQCKHKNSNVVGKPSRTILNWGSSVIPPELLKCRIINHPVMVVNAIDKLECFNQLAGHARVPEFTTSQSLAKIWLKDGYTVLARMTVTGARGEGIEILDAKNILGANGVLDIPSAPCYTKYIEKTQEYRIHIVDDKVIGYQQKIRDPEREPTNWKIRNHDSGFILVPMVKTQPPQDVIDQALKAIDRSGLDFGGVDVAWVAGANKAYVLEINTAPWLNESFAEKYATAIKTMVA